MRNKISDTKIPLEWNAEGGYWAFPLIEHEWAEFRGLIGPDSDGGNQIPSENYRIERSPRGEYRILWTTQDDNRPSHVYGLAAVRPKKPETFLGIPIAILVPIFAAVAGAGSTMAVRGTSDSSSHLSVTEACGESKDWVSSTELSQCKRNLTEAESSHESLERCRREEQDIRKVIVDSPRAHRLLYLLGRSHGQRLEVIKRFHTRPTARDLSLKAEKAYIENMLLRDVDSLAFTKGKTHGQQKAVEVLRLGDLQVLSGHEIIGR